VRTIYTHGWPGRITGCVWKIQLPTSSGALHICTIITTEPNQLMSTFHNRMPVILDQKDYDQWLNPAPHAKHPENLLLLLKPFPADKISAYPVSSLVNKPGNGPSRMCRTSVLIDNS